MAAPKTAAPAKVKVSLEDLKLPARDVAYTLDPKSPKVEVSPGTYVTRGVRVAGGVPSLVFVDGSRRTGLPFAVVATAILGQAITDPEIQAIQALRA